MKVEDGRPRLGPDPDAELDGLRQDDFLLGSQERHPSDLAQVQPRGVLHIEGSVVCGRIDVRVRTDLGLRRRRNVFESGFALDPLELGNRYDRIGRLVAIQLGVVRNLDQCLSACERTRMAMCVHGAGRSHPPWVFGVACRFRHVPDTRAGVSSLDTPA